MIIAKQISAGVVAATFVLGTGHAQADHGKGHAKGKNKVEHCHMKSDGTAKLINIPLMASLSHLENHDGDYLPQTPGTCELDEVVETDPCPLSDAEEQQMLSALGASVAGNDYEQYCTVSNTDGQVTLQLVAYENATAQNANYTAVLFSDYTGGTGGEFINYSVSQITEDEVRACAARFGCSVLADGQVGVD